MKSSLDPPPALTLPPLLRDCDDCTNGIVQDPQWTAWWERYDAVRSSFLVRRGASAEWDTSDERRSIEDEEPEGPEEIPCRTCDGEGGVPTEVGRQILRLVSRAQRQGHGT